MELISPNLVKHQDKQDVRRVSIVDQDPLHIEIGNGGRDDQGIIMGDM